VLSPSANRPVVGAPMAKSSRTPWGSLPARPMRTVFQAMAQGRRSAAAGRAGRMCRRSRASGTRVKDRDRIQDRRQRRTTSNEILNSDFLSSKLLLFTLRQPIDHSRSAGAGADSS